MFSTFDNVWEYLGSIVFGTFVTFLLVELLGVLRFLLVRPISLTEKQSRHGFAKHCILFPQLLKAGFENYD